MSTNRQDRGPLLITGDTRLNKALDAIPAALDYIVSLRPHDFDRLRNPFMRKHMSPRISLRRVAAMAGIPEATLLSNLAGMSDPNTATLLEDTPSEEPPQSPATSPAWLQGVDQGSLHWVDLLPIDDVLGDPFLAVNVAVRGMNPGDVIGIRHRWEPQPLYDIWQKMGIEWYAHQAAPTEWHIFVYKPHGTRPPVTARPILLELRYMPEDRVEPRLVATFEQLRPGESIEAWCLPGEVDRVRGILDARYPGAYVWEETEATPERVVIAIRPSGGRESKLISMRAAKSDR
jgi:hypothetical protein